MAIGQSHPEHGAWQALDDLASLTNHFRFLLTEIIRFRHSCLLTSLCQDVHSRLC